LKASILPTGFVVRDALAFADHVLSSPPARAHIERPAPRGERWARFALPLEFCKPQNRMARAGTQAAGWAIGKLKESILIAMLLQNGRVREPLPGRPQVLCLRLSSTEPDKYADWAKHAIDRLTVKHRGLGFLRDDRPQDAEIHQWWEPAPRGKGCVVIEVRS